MWYCLRLLAFQSHRLWSACCSLASVKSKGKKKRKRGDEGNSDEAEEFSESDSELGKLFHIDYRFKTLNSCSAIHVLDSESTQQVCVSA